MGSGTWTWPGWPWPDPPGRVPPGTCRSSCRWPEGRCWRCRRRPPVDRPWRRGDSRTVSLVDTLEPPTMATSGRAGWARALVRASSSEATQGPAQAILAYCPCRGGGLGPVGGAEGVMDPDVAQGGHLLGEVRRWTSSRPCCSGNSRASPLRPAGPQAAIDPVLPPGALPAQLGMPWRPGPGSPPSKLALGGRPRWEVTMTAAPFPGRIGCPAGRRGCGCRR